MQNREFNEAMTKGWEGAKMADLFKDDSKQLLEIIKPSHERVKNMAASTKEKIRAEIKRQEIVIPIEKSEEIQAFVDQQRRWSVPEQNIRRKVKKKFGIVVI